MSANKKKGLGRGLDALLSASSKADKAGFVADKVLQSLPLQRLQAGKNQPTTKQADDPHK